MLILGLIVTCKIVWNYWVWTRKDFNSTHKCCRCRYPNWLFLAI